MVLIQEQKALQTVVAEDVLALVLVDAMAVVLEHVDLTVLEHVHEVQQANLLQQAALNLVQVLVTEFAMVALALAQEENALVDARVVDVMLGVLEVVEEHVLDVQDAEILVLGHAVVDVTLPVKMPVDQVVWDALGAEVLVHQGAKAVLEIVIIHAKTLVAQMIAKALVVADAVQHAQKIVVQDVPLIAQLLVVLTVQVAQHNKGGFLWQI